MKKLLLTGIAALFLATGAAPAQAINWQVWKCPHGLFVDLQNEKDDAEHLKHGLATKTPPRLPGEPFSRSRR